MKSLFILIIILISSYSFAEEVFEYDAKNKGDPFVPLVSGQGVYVSDAYTIANIKDVRLEGIVWDEKDGSIAIINGEIIREGQQIGCVKVLKIESDAVVFEADEQKVRVELRDTNFRE